MTLPMLVRCNWTVAERQSAGECRESGRRFPRGRRVMKIFGHACVASETSVGVCVGGGGVGHLNRTAKGFDGGGGRTFVIYRKRPV